MAPSPFLMFGDSNSAVWPGTPRATDEVWPSRYAVRVAGETVGLPLLRNYSVGGMRMHYCKGQSAQPGVSWPAIETFAPDTLTALAAAGGPVPTKCLLMAGTNDLSPDGTPDAELQDFYAAYDVFDETLRDRWGITVYVVGVIPMRVTGIVSQATFNIRDPRRQALNQRLRTNFGDRYLEPSCLADSTGQLDARFAWSDGLHMNEWGHVQLSQAIPLSWVS